MDLGCGVVVGGGAGSQIIGVMEAPGSIVRVAAGGGGGSQIIGVTEARDVAVRVIAGGGGGSQIMGVSGGVIFGVVGGGGGGSQTIGQQRDDVALPESTIIIRMDFCRSLGNLFQGIIRVSCAEGHVADE